MPNNNFGRRVQGLDFDLLPESMRHYLSEVSRVLKRGGRCFITFFLINEESLGMIEAGAGGLISALYIIAMGNKWAENPPRSKYTHISMVTTTAVHRVLSDGFPFHCPSFDFPAIGGVGSCSTGAHSRLLIAARTP